MTTLPPLSVAHVLSETFRAFLAAWPCFILPFIPLSLASLWSNYRIADALYGPGGVTYEVPLQTPAQMSVLAPLIEFARLSVEILLGWGVTAWAMAMGYRRLTGQPAAPRLTLGLVFRSAWPLAVLSLFYLAVVGAGLLALILPGIYLAARYRVFPMAILVEGAGMSAMTPASELTRGTRPAVVTAVVIYFAIVYLGMLGGNALAGVLMGIGPGGPLMTGSGWANMTFVPLGDILAYGLTAAFGVTLYRALRQREAPGASANLAEVFA